MKTIDTDTNGAIIAANLGALIAAVGAGGFTNVVGHALINDLEPKPGFFLRRLMGIGVTCWSLKAAYNAMNGFFEGAGYIISGYNTCAEKINAHIEKVKEG